MGSLGESGVMGLVSDLRTLRLALALGTVWVSRIYAAPLAPSGGEWLTVGRAEHVNYGSTEEPRDVATEGDQGVVAESPAIGASGGGLVINATFDSSITADANAAAIEAMVNNAISVYHSLFSDPITVSILFRYSTTLPDGSSLPAGAVSLSETGLYAVPWHAYVNALIADATTANDATANASLPGSVLSTNILAASANGRAVGLSTPPAVFADGSVGAGGSFDGIVTLNSVAPFKFTRPPSSGMFDALRATEHEIDEVLGFGSYLNIGGSNLRPQDLFSWSAQGTRNLAASGSRYLSIDGGTTDIVGFNQTSPGDFGDWLSGSCPQANPLVQVAFGCTGQTSDVTGNSPEGTNLDVIGYDLMTSMSTTTTTIRFAGTLAPSTTTTVTTTTTTTLLPCETAPATGCQDAASRRAHVELGKDKIAWRWISSAAVATNDFGSPTTTTDYVLCVYDLTGIRLTARVPPGRMCGNRPCWRRLSSTGFTYGDRAGTPEGMTKLVLRSGGAGKGRITVKGGGINLHLPTLPLTSPVRVQLRQSSNACWEATYSTASKNTANKFKAKSD
jgi:hypothetical protein